MTNYYHCNIEKPKNIQTLTDRKPLRKKICILITKKMHDVFIITKAFFENNFPATIASNFAIKFGHIAMQKN